MESTVYFKTKGGNGYLYDSHTSYMINCHPMLQEFSFFFPQAKGKEELFLLVHDKFPTATNDELEYYFQKYIFLKENGLFREIDMEKHLSGRITASVVEQQLANVNDLVFQVTNLCNLDCVYCCYGDLYENTGRDTLHNVMDFDKAKKIIDYLQQYWNSDTNLSHKGHIIIGFYGGEPLTNFPLIRQIVEYTQTLHLKNESTFLYTMTTNSILLDRYMDFLAEHEVLLLLSLDGNEIHNSLRIDKDGKPSFKRVYQNIKMLQQKYPDYFERKVNFNSVLNRYSDAAAVQKFIYEEFGKETGIEAITYSGIKKEKINKFRDIYRAYEETTDSSVPYSQLFRATKDAGYFFYYHVGNAYRHHLDLLTTEKKELPRIPTGTCLPFWKKMFITPGGGIYACERIGFQHVLGYVDEEVKIDFDKIANKYNSYYEAISKQCVHCYQADSCPLCMMQFEQINGLPVCPSMSTKKKFQEYLSGIMSYLEKSPDLYNKVNKMIFA